MPCRERLRVEINSEILNALRSIAAEQGRPVQGLVEEALVDFIEQRKKSSNPRAHVMGEYVASHEKYGPLYKKLAE